MTLNGEKCLHKRGNLELKFFIEFQLSLTAVSLPDLIHCNNTL